MFKVMRDHIGLYIPVGGWIARTRFATRYKEGDHIGNVYHFGGSTRVGVGKDGSCLKGHYLEYWTTTGIGTTEYNDNKKRLPEQDFKKWLDSRLNDEFSVMSYGHPKSFK